MKENFAIVSIICIISIVIISGIRYNINLQDSNLNEQLLNIEEVPKEEKIKYVEKKDKNKRKGDREIVVEYRKPSIFTSILLILIGALIATIVLLSFYIYKEKSICYRHYYSSIFKSFLLLDSLFSSKL